MAIDANISIDGKSRGRYDFPEKVPKKLSDLENDLFNDSLTKLIVLHKEDFNMQNAAVLKDIKFCRLPQKLSWCKERDDIEVKLTVSGHGFAFYGDSIDFRICSKDNKNNVVAFIASCHEYEGVLPLIFIFSGFNINEDGIFEIPTDGYTIEDACYIMFFPMIDVEKVLDSNDTIEIYKREVTRKIDSSFLNTSHIESIINKKIDSLTERISALEEVNSTSTTQETTEETTWSLLSNPNVPIKIDDSNTETMYELKVIDGTLTIQEIA